MFYLPTCSSSFDLKGILILSGSQINHCNIPVRLWHDFRSKHVYTSIMKKQVLFTLAGTMAIALAVSASASHMAADYRENQLVLQDSVGRKKTDADSLPIPAPGRGPGKVDSTPFREETPRPVDPTPTPQPTDPPVPQPVKPGTSDTSSTH